MSYEFNPEKSLKMAQNPGEMENKGSMKQLNLLEIKNFINYKGEKLIEKAITYENTKK